ncbi:MAG: ComEC/Rec2 family competence protein [Rhodobacteraceae bacterium]|nr:ComEC/Rec2 family competence protein [Paracoccaceae bacterium]MCP5341869.1 ComEC/Rec2 family competence protein [Paracoccaceae bacterium]
MVAAARGRLMLWAPVFLGLGIGTYFALPAEPGAGVFAAGLAGLLGLVLLAVRGPEPGQVPAMALAWIVFGILLAGWRAHSVAAPVLGFRYYGPVEGRIVNIDRSFSDQIRLTLDRVVLKRLSPARTPSRVRVALHGEQGYIDPVPGLRVILTAHLSPPEGPVEPGGFDFQRLAWFDRLGAVGYTRTPVLALAAPSGGLSLLAFRARMAASRAMSSRMAGQPGAFAASLMTGDRSRVEAETTDALRAANLSHLISISGLHMGLLTSFVFAMTRYGLALIPPLALRINSKKVAAIVALHAAALYLILAGANIATQRAFIMMAVMLVAVLLDRRAISMRSVAIAALICLLLQPESLVEPGFQMSFSATVALIAVFEHWTKVQRRIPKPVRPVAMLLTSSLAAGLATAPVAAAHFNRIAEYGLLANLLAVPLMGTVVMPAGVIAAMSAPFGLAGPALWVMERGTAAILAIAHWVAGLEGALLPVPAPPASVLPLIAIGGLLALITRAAWLRGAGVSVLAGALALWSLAERPALLISGDGSLVGLMTPAGRALSKPRGAGFVAQSWLEDDGDLGDQPAAYARPGFSGRKGALQAALLGRPVFHFTGKAAASAARSVCKDGALVILSSNWPEPDPPDGCRIIDARALALSGALAIYAGKAGFTIVAARDIAGRRLWNTPARRKRPVKTADARGN